MKFADFTNYILDVLPAAVVRSEGGHTQQLSVRTILEDEGDLSRLEGQLDADAVRKLAASVDPAERMKLLPLVDVLRFDTAFVPIAGEAPPYLDEALEFGKNLRRTLLNFGAINCLRTCLERLQEDGFIQINDYGPTKGEEVAKFGTATRFGSSIAMGLNFPFLEYYFSAYGPIPAPPGDEERSVHSRMLTKKTLAETSQVFMKTFSAESPHVDSEASAIAQARKKAIAGKQSDALELFRLALRQNPGNWWIMGEAAEFLSRSGDPQSGINLVKWRSRETPGTVLGSGTHWATGSGR